MDIALDWYVWGRPENGYLNLYVYIHTFAAKIWEHDKP